MRLLALLLLLLVAGHAWARCPRDSTLAMFLAPGRYGVGHRTLTLVDATRGTPAWAGLPAAVSRTLPTEVWYPIDATGSAAPVDEAPLASGGPFPFVTNSPGLGDLGPGEAYFGTALASRGYVVASPTFPLTNTTFLLAPEGPYLPDIRNQMGDVSFVMDELLALSGSATWLSGGIDERRIGVTGLSLGGGTALLVTYHPTLRDRRVRAVAAVAPVACLFNADFYRSTRPPLLLIDGDEDLVTPIEVNARRAFERSRSPRRLVTLAGATHTAFSGFVANPSATSYDALSCALLEPTITVEDVDATIAAFGPESTPFIDRTGCDLPCVTPAPPTPPMQAARQHDLTEAAVVAFFEGTFGRSKAARCFLKRRLDEENDVSVESARARPLSRRPRPPGY